MKFYRRLRWWLSMWNSPDLHYREDYETLIRLARRCAYDFKHAADYVGREHAWMPEIAWSARAGSWVQLFAKGNPGKDYRTKQGTEIIQMEGDIRQLMELFEERGVPIPDHLELRYRNPF
jgi:hypothetical protein